jgi:hypothetical protein
LEDDGFEGSWSTLHLHRLVMCFLMATAGALAAGWRLARKM